MRPNGAKSGHSPTRYTEVLWIRIFIQPCSHGTETDYMDMMINYKIDFRNQKSFPEKLNTLPYYDA